MLGPNDDQDMKRENCSCWSQISLTLLTRKIMHETKGPWKS